MTKRVFIIAGEASGDMLGAGLVRALKKLAPGTIFFGVGGEEMLSAGVKSLFPLSDIAVMGLTEVLGHLPLIKRRMSETITAAKAFAPDVIITIDAPGFTGRTAKALKGVAPLVHYVAPSVWAYRPGRAQKLAEVYDLLLCFFEFEKPYFTRHGLRTIVVGHPASENIKMRKPRTQHGKNLVFLPGSRPGMAKRLLPIYKKVAEKLDAQITIPVVETNNALVRKATCSWPNKVKIISSREARYKAFTQADAAVSISGTGVLELALMGVPTVAIYKSSFITGVIARLMLTIRSVTLPNIILKRVMVKEFLQGAATAENIFAEVQRLTSDKTVRAKYARDAADLRRALARHKNPTLAAARAVAEMLK